MSNKTVAPFSEEYHNSSAIIHAQETLLLHQNNRLKMEAYRSSHSQNPKANGNISATTFSHDQTFTNNEEKRLKADVELNQMITQNLEPDAL